MQFHRWGMAALLALIPVVAATDTVRADTEALLITSPGQAVAIALDRSLTIRSAEASRQAVRGEGLQAGLWPNPEAAFTAENFGGMGGRGSYRGFDQTEVTIGLSQRLELGGKRSARVGFAGRNDDVASLDSEVARLDLARDVVTAIATAVAASKVAEIERERARLAAENVRIVQERVSAGKEALLQAKRAEVARTVAENAGERARREVEASLNSLALLMGVPRIALAPRQTWFDEIGAEPSAPQPADPLTRLQGNPDLVRFNAVIEQRRADVALQRANAVPDVTVQGGVRRFQEGRETAFIAGISVPLPFGDHNQGGIARASAELTRSELDAERGRAALIAALVTAEQRMRLAWRAAHSLRRSGVSAASQAVGFASAGYAEGKFPFLEVLDAQRALFDARAELADALREFHTRRAEVDRLHGQTAGLIGVGGRR